MARTPKSENNLENNIEDIDEIETAETTEKTDVSIPAEKTETTYIYAGPSLPNGQLKENTLFKNATIESLKEFLKEILEKYPAVIKLIIPAKKFAEMSQKIKTQGNIYNNYYKEILLPLKSTKKEGK